MFSVLRKVILVVLFLHLALILKAQTDEMNFSVANEQQVDTNLEDSIFYSLEEALKKTLKVNQLILEGKGLKTLPTKIYTFKNLKSLDISHNHIVTISDSLFTNCPKLEELRYAGNQLQTVPKSIYKATLKVLDLSENNLTSISDSIRFCTSLEELDLHANDVSTLPSENVILKKLKSLILSENSLQLKSVWVFLQPNLKILFLDETQLSILDNALCKSANLKFLNIEASQVKILPSCMCNLKQLKVIQCGDQMPKEEIDKLVKCLPNLKVR